MEKNQPTYNPKQAWTLGAMVLGVSLFFIFIIRPYLEPPPSAMVGKAAPDFVLPVIYGGEPGNRLRLSDMRGKAVLLDFWASWCAPCRAQAPIVDKLARGADADRVVVVGVNTGDDQRAAVRFAQQADLSYASVKDNGSITDAYGVTELPTIIIVTPDGKISAFKTRAVKQSDLEALIDQALERG